MSANNGPQTSTYSRIAIRTDYSVDDLIVSVQPKQKKSHEDTHFFNIGLRDQIERDLQLVRGKICSVMTRDFDHEWSRREGHDFMTYENHGANLAAYLFWLLESPSARSAVVIASPSGSLTAVYCTRVEGKFLFDLDTVECSFGCDRTLVGFSVPTSATP